MMLSSLQRDQVIILLEGHPSWERLFSPCTWRGHMPQQLMPAQTAAPSCCTWGAEGSLLWAGWLWQPRIFSSLLIWTRPGRAWPGLHSWWRKSSQMSPGFFPPSLTFSWPVWKGKGEIKKVFASPVFISAFRGWDEFRWFPAQFSSKAAVGREKSLLWDPHLAHRADRKIWRYRED